MVLKWLFSACSALAFWPMLQCAVLEGKTEGKKKIMEAYSQWLGCILTENTRIRSCWSIGLYQAIIMLMFARQVSRAKNSAPSLMVITLMPSSIVFNWGNLEWSVLCYGPFFFFVRRRDVGRHLSAFFYFLYPLSPKP